MSFLPRDPRDAPRGNRTIWLAVWMFEWGIVLVVMDLIMGFYALLGFNKSGSDIALVVGAPLAILTAMGGWGMSIYKDKSVKRNGRGEEEVPRTGGVP